MDNAANPALCRLWIENERVVVGALCEDDLGH
jgi:hypothetical protein